MSSHLAPFLNAGSVALSALSANLLNASSRTLFRSVCSSLLLVSPSGDIVFANEAAESMIGCSSDEMMGMRFDTLFLPEGNSATLAEGSAQADSQSAHRMRQIKGTLFCNNGAHLPARVSMRAVRDECGEEIGDVITIDDLSDYIQMSEYVAVMAHHDLHTGLPKAATILSHVDAAIVRLQNTGESFALTQIGIDHFRRINESVGHAAGDKVLREIGKRLESNLGRDGVLTRSSGAGFVVLFTACESQEAAVQRASALMRGFDEPFQVEDYVVRLTASVGIRFAAGSAVTQQSIMTEAELALRRSKSLGGNQVTSFEPDMADWHCQAVQTESKMQRALERGEFFVVYQPQICLKSGKLMGVEALLRWKNAEDGLIMPNTFIPIAEETGMIVQLGEWCLRTACRDIAALQQRIGYSITLAVNVSPKQARDERFCEVVQSALEASGLEAKCLEVEITEGLLISAEDDALRVIAGLQKMGISVSMDDFGTGFCNLGYITKFKVDRLKIDRSFINGCIEDRNSRMITTSILFLAKSLGIEVVAEGVETEEQSELLRSLDCHLAQGYLYSRPTTLDEIQKQAHKAAALSLEKLEEEMKASFDPAASISPQTSAPPMVESRPVVAVTNAKSATNKSYLEARDPICRPVYPTRKPGAARFRWQVVEDGLEAPVSAAREPVSVVLA